MNISRTHLNQILAQLDEIFRLPGLTNWHKVTIKVTIDLLRMYWQALEYREQEARKCWK